MPVTVSNLRMESCNIAVDVEGSPDRSGTLEISISDNLLEARQVQLTLRTHTEFFTVERNGKTLNVEAKLKSDSDTSTKQQMLKFCT